MTDLHDTPQRLLRLALLQLEEAKFGIVEAAFEENQAGGVVQRVAELCTRGDKQTPLIRRERPDIVVTGIGEVDRPVGTNLYAIVAAEAGSEEVRLPCRSVRPDGMRTSNPLPVEPPGPPSVPA